MNPPFSDFGYHSASGVFFDQDEPLRFLRPQNFVTTVGGTQNLLQYSNIMAGLSNSAWRFKYYHYDEWLSKQKTFQQLHQASGYNVTSGTLDWMRGNEPIVWYYYDQGVKGNYTRRLLKCASYPFDDISVPSGGLPVNFSGLPLLDAENSPIGSAPRVPTAAAEKLPWYQAAGLVKQMQTVFGNMFSNTIANSVHPACTVISGLAVPAVSLSIATQLNNLNLKPTGWISARPTGNIKSGSILPGSGKYEPVLDMAQQVNYPAEYISNINNVVAYNVASVPQSSGNTGCNITGKSSAAGNDCWISMLHFGFMQPTDINIQVNGSLPSVTWSGTKHDHFGNSTPVTYSAVPILTVQLQEYGDGTSIQNLTGSAFSLTDDGSQIGTIKGGGSFSYTITSSGYNSSTSGFNVPTGVNNLSNSALNSGLLLGYNTFQRYYDYLHDSESNAGNYFTKSTYNYRLLNQINSWVLTSQPASCGEYAYAGGDIAIDVFDVNYPYFTIDPSQLSITINGVNVPVQKNGGQNNSNTLPALSMVGKSAATITNVSSGNDCWEIIGGTITYNYTIPTFLACGYCYQTYYLNKPGLAIFDTCGIQGLGWCNFNCYTDFSKCWSFAKASCCANDSVQPPKDTCCTLLPLTPVETGKCGCGLFGCDANPPCGNNLLTPCNGLSTGTDYSKVYQWLMPGPLNVSLTNGCGLQLSSASLLPNPQAQGSGSCNAWTTFSYSQQFTLANGVFGLARNLNLWQNMTLTASIACEASCALKPTEYNDAGCIHCANAPCHCQNGDASPTATSPCPCKPLSLSCGTTGPWKKAPSSLSAMSPGDLLVNVFPGYVPSGGLCPGGGDQGSSDNNGQCLAPCGVCSGNFIVTDAGQSVSVDSIVCDFIIQCPDGTQSTLNFSLGGIGLTIPHPDANNNPVVAIQTANVGSAPKVCGSWWN